jgi:hypothetical protein
MTGAISPSKETILKIFQEKLLWFVAKYSRRQCYVKDLPFKKR